MTNKSEIHDLREVSCGLIPAMSNQLKEAMVNVVEFHIKQGIRLELLSSFGTDPHWEFSHESQIGHDVARFTRRTPSSGGSALNIVDY